MFLRRLRMDLEAEIIVLCFMLKIGAIESEVVLIFS